MALHRNKWGVYSYRATIPADVSATGFPQNFTFSLRTTNPTQAKLLHPQIQSVFIYVLTYFRQAGLVIERNPKPVRTGNIMTDLIASMTVGGTEITFKSPVGNETSMANVISQFLTKQAAGAVEEAVEEHSDETTKKVKNPDALSRSDRKSVRVDKLYEQYCQRTGIRPHSILADQTVIPYVQNLFGHTKMSDMTRDLAFAVKSRIPGLLSTFVSATGTRKRISAKRAARIFKTINAFFVWAMKQGNIDFNPFDNMELDVEVTEPNVVPYSLEELKILFESPQFFDDFVCDRGYRYWVCVIALFSGMRLSEIAQLEVKDVILAKDGRYYFNICKRSNVKGHIKRVKNAHSERVVPVSKRIIELGFPEYLETLKKARQNLLFPDISIDSKTHYTASGNMSLKFSQYRRAVLKNDKEQIFHSLRHNVVTLLKQKKFPLSDIQEFVGHAHGNITFDLYGEPQDAETMIALADALDFDVTFPHWEDRLQWKKTRARVYKANKEILDLPKH